MARLDDGNAGYPRLHTGREMSQERQRAQRQGGQRNPDPNAQRNQNPGGQRNQRPNGQKARKNQRGAVQARQQSQTRNNAQARQNVQAVYGGQPARNRQHVRTGPGPQAAGVQVKKKANSRRFYDYSLVFTIVFLTLFGLVMIYSASSYKAQIDYKDAAYFMKRQGIIAAGSFVIMLIISKIDYHFYAKLAGLGYVTAMVLMVAVLFVGRRVNGKRRWLQLGPISFQPAELGKIVLIVVLATAITKMGSQINERKGVRTVLLLTLGMTAPVIFNNLSSGIIIFGIGVVMLFVANNNKKYFFGLGILGVVSLFLVRPLAKLLETVGILQGYQASRIYVWLNPEAYAQDGGFQVLQGLYAIGSGGWLGKGLGESIQKLGFVPEAQNDMIFSIICEELGLFGAVSLILIFLFMIYRFMVIASNAPDLFGAMLVVGVLAHISIQVVLNIAVVTNVIPNTGITLPFISYGGTSVVFLMAEMGMVLSVSNQIKVES